MSQNRIEQLIEELYEYIESCKPKGFSFNTTQVVVMKEEIYDILDQMKLKIPEEIKRCSRVVAQKDQIIASAEEKAERILKLFEQIESDPNFNKDFETESEGDDIND